MVETINLIPQEERVQQTKTQVVKVSTWISLAILVIVVGVSGYFYYKSLTLKSKIKEIDGSIDALRTEINKLSDIEISARNLFTRSNTLGSIFESRVYYSKLLKELEIATPGSINVKSFGLSKDMTVTVSGEADNYNAVQEFSNKLLEREPFLEVTLNSVGLESQEDKVNFFILVKYSEEMLYD